MYLRNKDKLPALCLLLLLLATFSFVRALSVDELQQLIDQKRQEKAQLDEENKKLTEQINKTQEQAQSLSTTIKLLDQNAKKLGNDIKSTQTNISKTQFEIQQLGLKIGDAEQRISTSEKAISKVLRDLFEADDTSLIQSFLSGKTLADVWNDAENLNKFNGSLQEHVATLNDAKIQFTDKQEETKKKKQELQNLKNNLTVQQKIILENQVAKTKVLADTKSKETEFQKQLQANIERGHQIEQEQFDFESQLQIAIDPTKLPSERSGILSWPIFPITITQRFGATVDAKRLYISGTHNGIDFRASVGTPVKSVYSGTVVGTGNTDEQRGCYSYGRWILIRHPNGLSSIYAHLSGILVSQGQEVVAGQTIAFSGGQPGVYGSGYSTGPHLHLGIFATQGVSIQQYTSSKFCKRVFIPIAPVRAYLDPMAYLPSY